MAIYKNREVQVLDYGNLRTLADKITVESSSAGQEQASIGEIHFTKDEIKKLNEHKDIPYDSLLEASDEDLKAVRLGVAPTYSPGRIEVAKAEVITDEAKKMDDKLKADAKAMAEKNAAKQGTPVVKSTAEVNRTEGRIGVDPVKTQPFNASKAR